MITENEITNFLNVWLVDYLSMKYDDKSIELVKMLSEVFPYEGTLYRGLHKPFKRYAKDGTLRIDSWSKNREGIERLRHYGEWTFGFRKLDGNVRLMEEKEFQSYNSQSWRISPFDVVIEEIHKGLDLVALAKFVSYRQDFLSILNEVGEVLVIDDKNL